MYPSAAQAAPHLSKCWPLLALILSLLSAAASAQTPVEQASSPAAAEQPATSPEKTVEAPPPGPTFKTYRRPVVTWIPPYATARTKARLREQTPERDPAKALTHVAMQFWVPGPGGAVLRVKRYDRLTDEFIAEWRDWCHAQGTRALLCIYNGEDNWNWPLARTAFAENRDAFVTSLVREMELHGLDGIDLDLEGTGKFDADKGTYLSFVQQLSAELRTRQKQLFVDTFAYIWNAPNQQWWAELFPLVDGLNSMGYEETGARSTAWRAYSAQLQAAGPHAAKLLLGLPTHLDRWQESTVGEHLNWFTNTPGDGPGVALWDAQFLGSYWRSAESWRRLEGISGKAP